MYKLCYNLYYSRYGASKSNSKINRIIDFTIYFKLDTDIEIEPLTPLGLGLQTTNLGIFVTSVQPGSVGDIFGYRFGDQILSINNQVVHTSDDIRRIRWASQVLFRKALSGFGEQASLVRIRDIRIFGGKHFIEF